MNNKTKIIGVIMLGIMITILSMKEWGGKLNEPSLGGVFSVTMDAAEFNEVKWVPPTKDSDWTIDVKKENLNVKYDYQLTDMRDKLLNGELPEAVKEVKMLTEYPGYYTYKLINENLMTPEDAEIAYQSYLKDMIWMVAKRKQTIGRLEKEIELRRANKVNRTSEILGTRYYIDCINGNNANAGTGTTSATAWADIDQFMENARSAGDIATVRRGGTGCGSGTGASSTTNLTPTSAGSVNNPIVLMADYDNAWGDFTTSDQTYTVTFGTTTMTASAAIT